MSATIIHFIRRIGKTIVKTNNNSATFQALELIIRIIQKGISIQSSIRLGLFSFTSQFIGPARWPNLNFGLLPSIMQSTCGTARLIQLTNYRQSNASLVIITCNVSVSLVFLSTFLIPSCKMARNYLSGKEEVVEGFIWVLANITPPLLILFSIRIREQFSDTFSAVFSNGKFTDDVWNSLVLSNLDRHPNIDFAIAIVPFQDDEPRFERETTFEVETETNSGNDQPSLPTESTT